MPPDADDPRFPPTPTGMPGALERLNRGYGDSASGVFLAALTYRPKRPEDFAVGVEGQER